MKNTIISTVLTKFWFPPVMSQSSDSLGEGEGGEVHGLDRGDFGEDIYIGWC